jgi:hypothetical protein
VAGIIVGVEIAPCGRLCLQQAGGAQLAAPGAVESSAGPYDDQIAYTRRPAGMAQSSSIRSGVVPPVVYIAEALADYDVYWPEDSIKVWLRGTLHTAAVAWSLLGSTNRTRCDQDVREGSSNHSIGRATEQ